MHTERKNNARPVIAAVCAIVAAACSPTVKIEAPDKPIEINLNIKLEQEVRVRVDRDVDRTITGDPALVAAPHHAGASAVPEARP
jgi:hypothetical protein